MLINFDDCRSVMGKELRWETLQGSDVDGGASNQAAEFRNDSSEEISIRHLSFAHVWIGAAGVSGTGHVEISKGNALVSGTNNSPIFSLSQYLLIEDQGSTEVGGTIANGTYLFYDGALTLELGESLFVNYSFAAVTSTLVFTYHIGYHF